MNVEKKFRMFKTHMGLEGAFVLRSVRAKFARELRLFAALEFEMSCQVIFPLVTPRALRTTVPT